MKIAFLPIVITAALGIASARASYYGLTKETAEPQECITYDARYPYWTNGIYIATYPNHSRSKEGWGAPYYGGVVTDDKGNRTLLQFATWQMMGKGAPPTGIDFVEAGPHMSWKRSNWEGSSGGTKGHWPEAEFKRNQWYRFVHRVWTPTSPSPGLGLAGVWMKSLETGVWFHLATFKFPAELTGFNSMGGFHERFAANASRASAVEFRNSYALRNGKWTSEAEFTAFNAGDDTVRLTLSEDKRAVLMETTANEIDASTKKPAKGPIRHDKVMLTQPTQPDFYDPVTVDKVTAEVGGRRVAVRWNVDPRNSPQLGYEVTVLQGGQVVASEKRNDPEARLCVIELPAGAVHLLTARLHITDIFGRNSDAVTVAIPASAALPPVAVAPVAAGAYGLSYRYFETATPAQWTALPDFTKLASVREGAVAVPDITPRLRRDGYAFEFTGFLVAPESALYTLSLTGASALKLFIDGKPVIDADGYRSIACYKEAVPLLTGLHAIRLLYAQGPVQEQQPDDFLQLSWSRPGSPDTPIPVTAFRRRAEPFEPTVAVAVSGTPGVNLALVSKVQAGSHKVDRVEYYGQDFDFDYYSWQGAKAMDYLLASSPTPAEPVVASIWGGAQRVIRARLIYDGNRTVDSAPIAVGPAAPNGAAQQYRLTSLEHHLYPVGVEETKDKLTLVGDSMALYTQPHKGDVTLVAHLAAITPDKPNPDGTRPQDPGNWFSGIILRANTNPRPGEPLGGSTIPFSALMGSANGSTRHCDSTMINGAGNQPSGDIGSDLKWFKLVRRGADITTYASKDGSEWKLIKTVNLPKMPEEFEIGFVHYSIPSATPIVHRADFDHIRIEP